MSEEMFQKVCKDCGAQFEVIYSEQWKDLCFDCWKIRDKLKRQGLSKEEIEELRKTGIVVVKSPKTINNSPGFDNSKLQRVEVIQPALDFDKVKEMKAEYEGFIGETPKKGMQFKEISVSLGEKVSVNFQSKNAQIGAVISVGGVSVELAYQSALNEVKNRLKEEVKRIREEMR